MPCLNKPAVLVVIFYGVSSLLPKQPDKKVGVRLSLKTLSHSFFVFGAALSNFVFLFWRSGCLEKQEDGRQWRSWSSL